MILFQASNILIFLLVFLAQVCLHGTPNIFYWAQIGAFWWSSPPVNLVRYKVSFCKLAGMFWIIVLLESMAGSLWKLGFQQWQQTVL